MELGGTIRAVSIPWQHKLIHAALTTFAAKFASFETKLARCVSLVLPVDGKSDSGTSIAKINVFAGVLNGPDDPSLGLWGPTIDFPIVPVTAWVDPVSGDVMTMSSAAHDFFPESPGQTWTATWNATQGRVSEGKVDQTEHNMFCPGTSFDADSRLVVTGGSTDHKTSIYNATKWQWVVGHEMQVGRGYHSSATGADGRIFVVGGSWPRVSETKKDGEIYDPRANNWTALAQCPVAPMLIQDPDEGGYRRDNHAWLFAWKRNTVFQAGPSGKMNWYTTVGPGGHKERA
jgi:galactose oxidase